MIAPKYPSFAWYWDHDKKVVMDRLKGTNVVEVLSRNGIRLEDVYDYESFYNCLVVRLRNGSTILYDKEAIQK